MACPLSAPTWVHFIGIRFAEDMGNGMGIRLSVGDAIPADDTKQVHYNIYYSNTRFGVFDEMPKAITTANSVIVNVLPGKVYYFAIRATEFDPAEFDLTNLIQIANEVYQYPEEQELLDSFDAYGATVKVSNNDDYPGFGFLKVGSEIMKYTSKGIGEFYVEEAHRGWYGTEISEHVIGEVVTLWHGFEENNSNIKQGVAAWFASNGIPRNEAEIGQVNVDEDGYRAANEDIITTNLVASDQNTQDFPSYDYSGYHRPSLQDSMSGKCVNSYLGGEFNGGRGFQFQDRLLSQLDSMLQLTGEPAILLKRKWTGPRCRCISLQREHPRDRCSYCFSVGFDGGYDRFVNTRPISETFTNTQGMIMMRVTPFSDDLELVVDQGLRQPDEIVAWTLTFPTIKDRDIIVRFTEDGLEEFRYEVLSVTRNKLFFGQSGRQELKLRRLDKTDICMQFPVKI
jgi:hypothetical protein